MREQKWWTKKSKENLRTDRENAFNLIDSFVLRLSESTHKWVNWVSSSLNILSISVKRKNNKKTTNKRKWIFPIGFVQTALDEFLSRKYLTNKAAKCANVLNRWNGRYCGCLSLKTEQIFYISNNYDFSRNPTKIKQKYTLVPVAHLLNNRRFTIRLSLNLFLSLSLFYLYLCPYLSHSLSHSSLSLSTI